MDDGVLNSILRKEKPTMVVATEVRESLMDIDGDETDQATICIESIDNIIATSTFSKNHPVGPKLRFERKLFKGCLEDETACVAHCGAKFRSGIEQLDHTLVAFHLIHVLVGPFPGGITYLFVPGNLALNCLPK
jgi:hypothetical protein